jgi:hypothetical protein
MSPTRLRFLSCSLAILLAAPFPAAAFDTPLSDTAVREAYFMGQRRDISMERFFDRYTKHLPPPKRGPNISSISFLTPFALVADRSSREGCCYSAQQAEADHRNAGELVKVVVQVYYVEAFAYTQPRGFLNDFQVRVFDGEKLIQPQNFSSQPAYICSSEGGCTTIGVTLSLEFKPESFTVDTARVEVTPPQGDSVAADFDLTRLR